MLPPIAVARHGIELSTMGCCGRTLCGQYTHVQCCPVSICIGQQWHDHPSHTVGHDQAAGGEEQLAPSTSAAMSQDVRLYSFWAIDGQEMTLRRRRMLDPRPQQRLQLDPVGD